MAGGEQRAAPYRLIVAATDGSPAAREAIKVAVGLAGACGAKLQVIYVVNVHVAFQLGAYQQLAMDTLKEEGQRLVDEAVRRAKEAGVEAVEGVVLSGDPRKDLVDWCRQQGADLIVLGSHGYSFFSTLMLGSVAEYIVHNAPCDVLLVREQGDREGSKEG
ncbi:MAG: hypothetical protein PWQ39_1253 [Thermacetogenium sp.]|jgi:nucleotide-binding universal stress UspA family protein|nr:hypothetical protein [Thermacetogenium sp.]